MADISIEGGLSIDARSIEEVHADLLTKRMQVGEQTEVINEARSYVEENKVLDRSALLAILNKAFR
jgi:hypothetical protein